MERKIIKMVQGYRTRDGAGVSLVRVLGKDTIEDFDPILMLDSFDSTNPEDYISCKRKNSRKTEQRRQRSYKKFNRRSASLIYKFEKAR